MDVVLLTKTDLVNAEQRNAAQAVVLAAAPGVLVIEASAVDLTVDVLLGSHAGCTDRRPPERVDMPAAHELFRSWQAMEAEPVKQASFQRLLTTLPPGTVRGKGHVYMAEFPTNRFCSR